MQPTSVIVDTREQKPWTFDGQYIKTIRRKLDAADYSLDGLETRVAIERKSLDDFIGTVLRDRQRFYRELDLLRAFEFRCVIIESSVREIFTPGAFRSRMPPQAVMGFVAEIAVSQCVPVYLGGTCAESQLLAGFFLRMAAKKFNLEIGSTL